MLFENKIKKIIFKLQSYITLIVFSTADVVLQGLNYKLDSGKTLCHVLVRDISPRRFLGSLKF